MNKLNLLLLLTFLLFLNTGCQQFQVSTSPEHKLQHIVLVWLKDPSPQNREKVMTRSKSLFDIEELLAMDMGVTIKSDRSIVDDSFDIGYVMTFKDQAAMERYLVHPVHVKLVNEVLKPSMSRVQVYDILTR